MTINTAFALASEASARTRRIKWPLVVAGALAAASAIDLMTGFSLTIPDEVIAEVKAIAQETDQLESGKQAASGKQAISVLGVSHPGLVTAEAAGRPRLADSGPLMRGK